MGTGERTEYKNYILYRGINLLSMVRKIYVGILVDRVCRMTKGLIDDGQRGFRSVSEYVDKIFRLKQIGEKAYKKK